MIASVARESGRSVESVAGDSYALTLYAHLQYSDIEYQRSLLREEEAIAHAEMIAVAFHEPKSLKSFRQNWRQRAYPIPNIESVRERMSREADELWAQHERALNRPVS